MKPIKLAITGGIASGKSSVSEILRNKGFKVIDSDKIGHSLLEKDQAGYGPVIDAFSKDILDKQDNIDREKLGQLIFSSDKNRLRLNEILHPLIVEIIKKQIDDSQEDIVFVEIPLFFEVEDSMVEAGLLFDRVITVYIKREDQIKRLMERNHLTRDQAIKRINTQINIEEKKARSQIVIDNSGGREDLIGQVNKALEELELNEKETPIK